MGKKIKLRLNNFLYNAGIIGFLNLLEWAGTDTHEMMAGNELSVDSEIFSDFTSIFFEGMKAKYKHDTAYTSIRF